MIDKAFLKDKAPLVSIIMPAFNAAYFIQESIQSVLAQSFSDFELIVINDGSTDDTSALVQNVKDPRIILIEQENAGVAAARNNGIEVSRGKFIAFLDSDDLWSKTKIEKQVNLLTSNPEIGLTYSDIFCFEKSLKDSYYVPPYKEQKKIENI